MLFWNYEGNHQITVKRIKTSSTDGYANYIIGTTLNFLRYEIFEIINNLRYYTSRSNWISIFSNLKKRKNKTVKNKLKKKKNTTIKNIKVKNEFKNHGFLRNA